MDAGPILLQREIPITPHDTQTLLTHRLSELGAEALLETLPLLGTLEPQEQDPTRVTFAPRVDRETARIDFTLPAEAVACHVRGMDAVPGAWTELDGEPVKLFHPRVVDAEALAHEPLAFPAGDGRGVAFDEIQPAGKRRMSTEAWARGHLS
jgi:methionyl-tRNA formyltransferase